MRGIEVLVLFPEESARSGGRPGFSEGTIKSCRDVHPTATDSHIGVELDRGLLFVAFTPKTFPNRCTAGNFSDRLAAVRIPPLSSVGVALPGEAIFYSGGRRGNCSAFECGLAGAVRKTVSFTR